MRPPRRPALPHALTVAAVQIVASLSCHSEVTSPTSDASADVSADVAGDASGDVACPLGGGCASVQDGAVCPQEVCTEAECPTDAGCVFI